ncbi:epoxide hydrolase family protein [Paractinoplanes brasiliensis]|uniref:Pimeloyl-ACP methyl ester carboxylesterase n=1 Tax=Paractinoplanes brasiliensis TaxID=52695 RepID=A0A4R6JC07_9ACTN|nr:epoxide hydrolase family protein [Actinoplanes brasiliensis]TDO32461.1 pimeloyl-ACP methyl ester carboxylesterase [Actinoplanes brasiliensis]GID27666.1 hydrolase [Actinoplanes brasiliensis]
MTLLNVSDEDLDDLRARLRATRWARQWPLDGRNAGFDGAELRRLVEFWASAYDWRKHEAAINALPSGSAEIDGLTVPYLRFDAERADAPALLMANGWPSSFLELTGLAERLSQPSRFGGDPADALTVVLPSLPGFGVAPQRPALGAPHTHDLWHRLMREALGFEHYGLHGSDIGAGDVIRIAQAHPEAVTGLHVLDLADPPSFDPASLTDEERAYLERKQQWFAAERGYSHQQETRPLTLAQGLTDSPSGLLAWIGEKYRAWSDDPAKIDDEFLLTQASLYWFTGSVSTSFRPYYERGHDLVPPVERVETPTALALFPADIPGGQPRSWAERTYNLARYTVMPRGGHFAAYEETELLAEDITVFFRTLR